MAQVSIGTVEDFRKVREMYKGLPKRLRSKMKRAVKCEMTAVGAKGAAYRRSWHEVRKV